MKRRIALLLSLCLMAGMMPVMAEGSMADDMTFTAEELYQAGMAAYASGDYARAADYYEQALERYREAVEKDGAAAVEQPDRPDGEGNAANGAAALERLMR